MIDLAPLNTSITLLLNHLTTHYGPQAELETYVICTRVRSPDVEGGSGISWIVGPNGQGRAGGLLQDVLRAVDSNGPDQT
jgi:hypothetical protein